MTSDIKEKVIRTLELRLEILREGLAVPYDAQAIRHYQAMLDLARQTPADDAGMQLAAKLDAKGQV